MSNAANLLKNPAILLIAFALIGSALVAIVFDETEERIKQNERDALLKTLNQMVPAEHYDNAMLSDRIEVIAPQELGSLEPTTVYRARRDGKPVAAVFNTIAPDGYNGRIRLLVAVLKDGSLGGVRVVTHRETPGLGDGIDLARSDWILQFDDRSLLSPTLPLWKVRKDKGEFDQLTGATITPRAIVKAVRRVLVYFDQHQNNIFSQPALPEINE